MIQKKICMLGAFAVGKTSLVGRFVRSIFSESYLTTVGVKIDRKNVTLGDQEVKLILWDLYGEDDFQSVRTSYLRGSAGFLLVADGTRAPTLDTAIRLHSVAVEGVRPVPTILVINKSDLASDWEIEEKNLEQLAETGWTVMRASAKTGEGVEEAFLAVSRAILEASEVA